jgi:predicted DNA-binding protein
MSQESKAMVSRSLRLHKNTLERLQKEADKLGLGITVYIRTVLEKLVDNLEVPDDEKLRYPEL